MSCNEQVAVAAAAPARKRRCGPSSRAARSRSWARSRATPDCPTPRPAPLCARRRWPRRRGCPTACRCRAAWAGRPLRRPSTASRRRPATRPTSKTSAKFVSRPCERAVLLSIQSHFRWIHIFNRVPVDCNSIESGRIPFNGIQFETFKSSSEWSWTGFQSDRNAHDPSARPHVQGAYLPVFQIFVKNGVHLLEVLLFALFLPPPSRLDCVELCFSNLLYSRLICGRSEVSNCFGRVINNQVRISLYGGSIQRLHLPFFL